MGWIAFLDQALNGSHQPSNLPSITSSTTSLTAHTKIYSTDHTTDSSTSESMLHPELQTAVQTTGQATAQIYRPLLLVTEAREFIQRLARLAQSRGIRVGVANRLAIAQNLIAMGKELVLLEFVLADATEQDLTCLAEFTHQAIPVPILFLTDDGKMMPRLQAAQLSTPTVLSSSISPEQVLAIVQLSRAIGEKSFQYR
jgi:DNA-binding NarL/FixJ family response regulator